MATQFRNLVGHGISTTNVTLVAEKIEEWEWYTRFIEMNPDIKQRWEQHKTYEILKDEHRTR